MLLLHCLQQKLGNKFSDALQIKLYLHSNQEEEDDWATYLDWVSLSEWLPPLNRPDKTLTTKTFQKLWEAYQKNNASINETALYLLCQKNPCTASERFLRQHIEGNPEVLLICRFLIL